MLSPKIFIARTWERLNAAFGRGLVVSMGSILLVGVALSLAAFAFFNAAAPTTLTITSGPEGSSFRRYAESYKKILARQGVELKILPSEGAYENFKKLSDPKSHVDIGFVLGGEIKDADVSHLVSLGSVSYQPLMVFYRGKPRTLLSEFKGQRIEIGKEGSGAHILALDLLKANGIEPGDETRLIQSAETEASVKALHENRIDVLFMMGDSVSTDVMRSMLHNPDIHLFSFTQADAYTRRFQYLNKLVLPRGAIDFGKDIPGEDLNLIGPTVELVARENLHPALSDILLEAAKETHSRAGIFKKGGEFPAPLEHEFRISADATRFYTSGKSFLYRSFPFWLASLIARFLAFVIPIAILVVPGIKIAPAIYRWRIQSRIYRWYRALLELEREAFSPPITPPRQKELLHRLQHIEKKVSKVTVPASFADLFYALRGHISFVQEKLLTEIHEEKKVVDVDED